LSSSSVFAVGEIKDAAVMMAVETGVSTAEYVASNISSTVKSDVDTVEKDASSHTAGQNIPDSK
jgi:hypothetical protein